MINTQTLLLFFFSNSYPILTPAVPWYNGLEYFLITSQHSILHRAEDTSRFQKETQSRPPRIGANKSLSRFNQLYAVCSRPMTRQKLQEKTANRCLLQVD